MNPSRFHYADLVAAGLWFLTFALIPTMNMWLIGAAGGVGLLLSFLELRYHQGRLCERCMASFPLDAANAAERSRLSMRVTHFLLDRPHWHWVVGTTVVLTAFVWSLELVSAWIAPVFGLVLVALTLAVRQHQRLQPWCPYCHRGGGGEEEESPVAPPTPSTSR